MAHLTWIRVLQSNSFRKSVLKRFGTLPKMSCAKLSEDDTCFQFQYYLCICMDSVIVRLGFHQIWLLCDLWFKRYWTKCVSVAKTQKSTLRRNSPFAKKTIESGCGWEWPANHSNKKNPPFEISRSAPAFRDVPLKLLNRLQTGTSVIVKGTTPCMAYQRLIRGQFRIRWGGSILI